MTKSYFVFSNYINAYAIKDGLSRLGLGLEVLTEEPGFFKSSARRPEKGDTLFFTSERELKQYFQQEDFNYLPRHIDTALLDDKFAFAEFLSGIGEQPVPYWPLESELPELPVYFKAKLSWMGNRRLPRGYVCHNANDYQEILQKISVEGLEPDLFFFQRLIHADYTDNISTSGFYNHTTPEQNVMVVTRKVLGDKGRFALGAIIETIPDPEKLIERTQIILNAMQFTGPFELEFLRDPATGHYYVLELNPRFWMQHSIFLDHFNNLLLKRYLNIDTPAVAVPLPYQHIIWLSTTHFLLALLSLRWSQLAAFWRCYRTGHRSGSALCLYPPLLPSLRFLVRKGLYTLSQR